MDAVWWTAYVLKMKGLDQGMVLGCSDRREAAAKPVTRLR